MTITKAEFENYATEVALCCDADDFFGDEKFEVRVRANDVNRLIAHLNSDDAIAICERAGAILGEKIAHFMTGPFRKPQLKEAVEAFRAENARADEHRVRIIEAAKLYCELVRAEGEAREQAKRAYHTAFRRLLDEHDAATLSAMLMASKLLQGEPYSLWDDKDYTLCVAVAYKLDAKIVEASRGLLTVYPSQSKHEHEH